MPAGATFILCLLLHSPAIVFPCDVYNALVDSLLTGLLVVVVMTLATGSGGQSVPFAALWPVALITILLFALGTWTFIAGHPNPTRLFRAAAEKSASVALIVLVLLSFARWAGAAPTRRWVGPGLVALVSRRSGSSARIRWWHSPAKSLHAGGNLARVVEVHREERDEDRVVELRVVDAEPGP